MSVWGYSSKEVSVPARAIFGCTVPEAIGALVEGQRLTLAVDTPPAQFSVPVVVVSFDPETRMAEFALSIEDGRRVRDYLWMF